MSDTPTTESRLIVVSNRLPISMSREENGTWQIEPAAGGLVTALAPVLRERGGVWIGWPGTVAEEGPDLDQIRSGAGAEAGYELDPVVLTAAERDKFYLGFANEIVWPLFHDLQSHCNFDPSYWEVYEQVNSKFAEVVLRHCRPGDYIWVHDYHLMHVAHYLRREGVTCPIGFFLHIPFPPLDIFLKLPWRAQVLTALLEYDLVGFQTLRDRYNFVNCVRALVEESSVHGTGQVITMRIGDREVRLGSFPISIDARAFADEAASPDVAEHVRTLHDAFPGQQIVLGVDRLDYTKGLPHKLEAFRAALRRYPELVGKLTLVQVVVPSRTEISTYADLKDEVDRLVGEINGQFTQPGWVPIHYIVRSLDQPELLAYYRGSHIAFVTSLKDGMNLVAKEYCACSAGDGVLIMSEFAGAAGQFCRDALLVNPYDVAGMAEAVYRAWSMSADERRTRMRNLKEHVAKYDVFWWVESFLAAGLADDLAGFADDEVENYLPKIRLER